MEQFCEACVTRQAIRGLCSRLYTVAARVAETCPELLPTVALAALSLDAPEQTENAFLQMVVCALAVEARLASRRGGDGPISLDVSAWLAAEPSDALLVAVGEGLAYYYAAIPGVLSCLDQSCVLF